MNRNVQPTWRTWPRFSRRRRPASSGEPFVPGLSFRAAPGPLLAVAGLSGGAGASVLAYLIAVTAARESSVPVLVADTGGSTGGLSCHAGVSAPRTLADIAQRIAAEEPLTGALWAEGEHGLRVLASAPQFTVDGDRDAILRVLKTPVRPTASRSRTRAPSRAAPSTPRSPPRPMSPGRCPRAPTA